MVVGGGGGRGERERGVVGRKDQMDKKKKEVFLALRVCAKLYILGKLKRKKSISSTQSLCKTVYFGKVEKKHF